MAAQLVIGCSQCVVLSCVWGSVCHFMAEGSCYYHHTEDGWMDGRVGPTYMYMYMQIIVVIADAYDMGYCVCQTMQDFPLNCLNVQLQF